MIRLGFINDPAQAPPGTPLVRTAKASALGVKPGPCVSAAPDGTGQQRFELTFAAPEPNGGEGAAWPADMAKAIVGLGWNLWRFDPLSPARVWDGTVEQALMAWGKAFWPALDMDCDVLLDVTGGARNQVYQAVRVWEKACNRVRFVRELDFESASSVEPPKRGKSLRGIFSRFFHS